MNQCLPLPARLELEPQRLRHNVDEVLGEVQASSVLASSRLSKPVVTAR
jgi:hypothetical protein